MRRNNSDQSSDSTEIYAAKLAYIGATISTIGDGLQAISAGIALEILEKSKNQDSQNQQIQSKDSENLQKQIDYLMKELNKFKRIIR
ncbi:translation initiation factor 2 [Paenibacillus sp. BK033]|uniref:translation initiation factor 2 n=1 Tax=Paenibacillus sp. BK033 TaxID=2512133 RepID=UPI001052A3E4|nr:translation initiation factor 2 [Paenibacillus sp. BK033]